MDEWKSLSKPLVAIVAGALYCNTLCADFVYDDRVAIIRNEDITERGKWANLLRNDFWGTPLNHSGSHKSYRPVTVATFAFNYWLGGLNPIGYHLLNVLLHMVASVQVLSLCQTVVNMSWVFSTFSALLFAVHPVHTEAVAGVVGRADVLATIFGLFAIYCCERYRCTENICWLICCSVAGMVATFCKEHAIAALPICVGMYALKEVANGKWRDQQDSPRRIKALLHTTLILSFTTIFICLLRLWLIGFKPPSFSPSDNPAAHSESFQTRTLTFLYLGAFNFYLLLFPNTLSFDWSMGSVPLIETVIDRRNIVSLSFYCCLILFSWKLATAIARLVINYSTECRTDSPSSRESEMSRSPSPKLDLNANVVVSTKRTKRSRYLDGHSPPGSPTSGHYFTSRATSTLFNFEPISPTQDETSRERVEGASVAFLILVLPYLPASNLLVYVGFVVAERVLYLSSVGYCILVGIGAQFLWERLDARSRYRQLVKTMCVLTLIAFGARTFTRNADWRDEISLYKAGLAVNPAKAYANLGQTYTELNQPEEAESAYRKSLQIRPNSADVHYNLGNLLRDAGRLDEAVKRFEKATQVRTSFANAYLNWAMCMKTLGHVNRATEILKTCTTVDPSESKQPVVQENGRIACAYNLGVIYSESGQDLEAIKWHKVAIRYKEESPFRYSNPPSLYNALGQEYAKIGRPVEAETSYQRALSESPTYVKAHITMGHLRMNQGQMTDAHRWFTRAAELDKNSSITHYHLGQYYHKAGDLNLAVEALEKARELQPENMDTLFALASINRELGKNHLAEQQYRELALKRPAADSVAHLGAILHLNRKYAEAELTYLKAIEMNPNDGVTGENLRKLRRAMKAEED